LIIEIHGAGFDNKGAELMLRTTVSELQRRIEHFIPAIDPMYGTYQARCNLGLYQIVPPRSHVGTPGFLTRFRRQKRVAALAKAYPFRRLSQRSTDLYGMVDISRVAGFIDIAGFAYTDQWGTQPTLDMATLTEYYRKHKKPVILLPQAFGPFERPESQSAFAQVLHHADLVFARDQQSWEYAAALAPNPDKIMQAPDITLFYPKQQVHPSVPATPYVCLVPNIRILDQGKHEWGEKYITYLCCIGKELLRQGIAVKIVIHDVAGDDLNLAQTILQGIESPTVEIIHEQDVLTLRRIIEQSLLVIGSRYHSLVAAFASGVPALGIGWSHKYQMLFSDFACADLLLSPTAALDDVLEKVTKLTYVSTNRARRNEILTQLQNLQTANDKMWKQVTDLLTHHQL